MLEEQRSSAINEGTFRFLFFPERKPNAMKKKKSPQDRY
jgi:hypothetical protein